MNRNSSGSVTRMLLVMGVVFFFVYFLLFSAVIRMFNLKTPGREDPHECPAPLR
jgi:phosphotransferase system  glucose/maltose/N-acetylglucosamine-specific IIC component